MANSNAPFGLRPLTTFSGQTAFANRTIPGGIDKDDTQACFRGDMLKYVTTGYVAQWTAATEVSQFAGVFWGCSYNSISQGKYIYNNIWPGSDAADDVDVHIIPAQGTEPALFQIQTNATGVVSTDLYGNFDVTVGSGNTTTGWSGMVLNVGSINTTATLPLRLIQLWTGAMGGIIGPGTQAGAYNWAIVQANVAGAGATGLAA